MTSKPKILKRKERFVESLARMTSNIDILEAVEQKYNNIKKMI